MSSAVDTPYLHLPLTGVQAIEASAGTGKTFTLATLVLRLVVERGLRIDQILAVTFTEAATQELRARIRRRLQMAAMLAASAGDAGASPDDAEHATTRAVIAAQLAAGIESADALAQRLREAADSIDLASVFTIHGFCARVLREHALESGHGFAPPALLADDRALRGEAAADLWRLHANDDAGADDLLALWNSGPDALAADLLPLLREQALQPQPDVPMPVDPAPRLHAANIALAQGWRRHGGDFAAALLSAVQGKVLNGNSYKMTWLQPLLLALDRWSAHDVPDAAFDDPKLAMLAAQALQARTNKGKEAQTPQSAFSALVDDYLQVVADMQAHRESRRTALLHRLREQARARIANSKRQRRVQTYDDLIERVAAALEGGQADALVRRLRAQYAVALVDEFQDTDPRQWWIFNRVFGTASAASMDAPPALFLIGDPKQAIYGFRGGDVHTYLHARQQAVIAPPLGRNFRSRPALLQAVSALYAGADAASVAGAFGNDGIRFHAVAPGGSRSDADHQRDGQPAAALTVWRAPPSGRTDKKGAPAAYSAEQSRAWATRACVADIHRVLSAAREGDACIDGRAVQPGDIAVLVRSHGDATRIRQALAAVGIPAVAAGKQDLFATTEARELHALLLALLHAGDDGYLRTALASVLLGVDAAGIAALGDVRAGEAAAMRDWQQHAQGWRERLQRGGVLALVNDLAAEHAQRLLALLDGERRLSNYLQLAELLQEAALHTLGLAGLVEWLEHAIGSAGNGDDETRLLRLESDARRVQVVTLHKSKGLEYPLVYLPFAGIGRKPPDAGQHVLVNGEEGRTLHWKLQIATSGWEDAKERWQQAEQEEAARLLYVGLTRARDALWVATGPFYHQSSTPLAPMLADPDALLARAGAGNIVLDDTLPAAALAWLTLPGQTPVPPPRKAARGISADWWVYSFTQLAQADAGHATLAAATEPDAGGGAADEAVLVDVDAAALADAGATSIAVAADGFDPRFSGSRFGNVLHAALEQVDFSAWSSWRDGQPAPQHDSDILLAALQAEGYAQDDLEAGVDLLTSLVGRTLHAPLPEGGALHALPADARRAEIEFHFTMQPTAVPALLDLLHAHGGVRGRGGFGARRMLEGLMTGKIDLTYIQGGRWHVLDYKSNRLDSYSPPALAAAMAHSEYDLQALIYTVALHRWLRFRLGDGYDYARDFGGVRYLFCRGLAMPGDPDAAQTGVFAHLPPAPLVHALDALFGGGDA